MAKGLEKERASIAADEAQLIERKKRLIEKEREMLQKSIERSALMKLSPDDLNQFLDRLKALGFNEVQRRLAA